MAMPGPYDPTVQDVTNDLTGFLRRNLPREAPRRPMPMPAQRPAMPPGASGMDPEALARALLGPDADPETIQRMLASIAQNGGLPLGGGRTPMPPSGAEAMLASRPGRAEAYGDPGPMPPAPDWTKGVARDAQPLGLPPKGLLGAGMMGLGLAVPPSSPALGALGGALGGFGGGLLADQSPMGATFSGLGGALAGGAMGALGGARPPMRSPMQAPEPMPMTPARAQPSARPMVDAEALEGMTGPAGMAQHSDPYFPAPGPMPRNDRNVGGKFIRPWRADEIQGALTQPAGLPQLSLLSRFEGEMARTQPGSPIADAGLRGMDPGDWFSKTQPDVGMAGRLEGAMPQQDAIMAMLRRQAPNPMMQPAGMPDPDGMRAFFEALAGMRGGR